MNLWRSIDGMVEAELTSAALEDALLAVNAAGITLFHMEQTGYLTCRFDISRRDLKQLDALVKKRGEHMRLIGRTGIFWSIKTLFHRQVLLLGGLLLLAAVCWLPTRVLFVQVEGNQKIPSRQILAAAEECGIRFGASRREVRSEKVKNDLLGMLDQLQWAGVNTSGCVAVISVRERSDFQEEADTVSFSNIAAVRDGYILAGTATQGTPLFQPGQTVKKGQILISGFTDCGICIQTSRAEGEIFAQTSHNLQAVMPASCMEHGDHTVCKRKISLIFRKKRINLWKDSGISQGSCGRMYEEYYATLPGRFQLPIALCVETFYTCSPVLLQITKEDAERSMKHFAQEYVIGQMIAGEIHGSEETVLLDGGAYCLQGDYICTEMIGREQIGEIHGKDS